jgi:diadenosine tetraphosphate (Ap4A) HIT family hydrolase
MPPFVPPAHLVIGETDHWIVNHRADAALPGYLVVGTRAETERLSDLPTAALTEVGPLLAWAERELRGLLKPEHFYVSRYGHSAGHSCHFHLIPVCGWVKRLHEQDPRYRPFHALYTDKSTVPDGAALTFYIWREFCEQPLPPPVEGPSVPEVVAALRKAWTK